MTITDSTSYSEELPAEELSLAVPRLEKGIGKVILRPDSTELIADVICESAAIWPDDRGYFMEILRCGKGPASFYPPESTQVSSALSYEGTIKAFHFHERQHDFWVPVAGMFQVALVDLRKDSPTFGLRNTMYLGNLRPWRILIPPGVAHGYKVVGPAPGVLVYVTSRQYDPSDEGRIVYNHPGIAYDWELQHK